MSRGRTPAFLISLKPQLLIRRQYIKRQCDRGCPSAFRQAYKDLRNKATRHFPRHRFGLISSCLALLYATLIKAAKTLAHAAAHRQMFSLTCFTGLKPSRFACPASDFISVPLRNQQWCCSFLFDLLVVALRQINLPRRGHDGKPTSAPRLGGDFKEP